MTVPADLTSNGGNKLPALLSILALGFAASLKLISGVLLKVRLHRLYGVRRVEPFGVLNKALVSFLHVVALLFAHGILLSTNH